MPFSQSPSPHLATWWHRLHETRPSDCGFPACKSAVVSCSTSYLSPSSAFLLSVLIPPPTPTPISLPERGNLRYSGPTLPRSDAWTLQAMATLYSLLLMTRPSRLVSHVCPSVDRRVSNGRGPTIEPLVLKRWRTHPSSDQCLGTRQPIEMSDHMICQVMLIFPGRCGQ